VSPVAGMRAQPCAPHGAGHTGSPLYPLSLHHRAARIVCVGPGGWGGFPDAFGSPVGPGRSDAPQHRCSAAGAVWSVAGSGGRGRVARSRCSPHRAGWSYAVGWPVVSARAERPDGMCRPGRRRRPPRSARRRRAAVAGDVQQPGRRTRHRPTCPQDACHGRGSALNPPPAEAGGFLAHAARSLSEQSSPTRSTPAGLRPARVPEAWRLLCRLGSRSARRTCLVLATRGVQPTRSGGRSFALAAKPRSLPCSAGVRFLPGLKSGASSEESGDGDTGDTGRPRRHRPAVLPRPLTRPLPQPANRTERPWTALNSAT
jgi:hypothetical protein